MWCDNCLLIFPLRAGGMAWATIILLYSSIGGIFLFHYGPFLFFVYPEWQVYGGIALAVAVTAALNTLALANRSYVWSRACVVLWPFLIVISAIRDIIMIVELQRGKENIEWECANGGQLWTTSAAAGYGSGNVPSVFCTAGFSSLNTAFIVCLLADLVFQTYMLFITWRYATRLDRYSSLKIEEA
ncbi:hypothetical protein DFH94DRAFT_734883 [Russula ochroleuca]|jgi:hypothetical protein|uniref:Uncharacterized protein n=1 Tax=Russula ochroleuca TaxID=152965 RepID=A0A9P5MZ33_9AGAM|nr:hypothetical protein DFH94DRAFT_734883 [Russula ochroleuca]